MKDSDNRNWTEKPQHGYIFRKQEIQNGYSISLNNNWLNDKYMTSHVEGYICAMQEQEIRTKLLDKQRNNNKDINGKCRHCHHADESIFHVLSSCEKLSTNLYLHVRHNEVAKVVYNEIIGRYHDEEFISNPEPIYTTSKIEVWWDKKIKVSSPVVNNRPDIVVWDRDKKSCFIIDICIPLDVNVEREEKAKRDKYMILAGGLQRLYSDYSFIVIPIVLGATGYVPKSL